VDQKADGRLPVFQAPHDLSGLLGHPTGIWLSRTPGKVDLSAAQFDEKEHVQRLQKYRVKGEEIAGQEVILVVAHQLSPAA
jgi:hypothetical protein